MSVKITLTELHASGRKVTVETPLSSVAATDSQTPYAETQRMIADHAALTLHSLTSSGQHAYPLHPDSHVRVDILDRRLLDSCYVRPAYGREPLLEDELVVGLRGPGSGVVKFVFKEFTPPRRVFNAFAGAIRRDVKGLELKWRGRRVGKGKGVTAGKVCCSCRKEVGRCVC